MTQIITDMEIFSYIKKSGSASIGGVCMAFEISQSTARRAFARLERDGLIRRYGGGAVALSRKDTPYEQRLSVFCESKDLIAREASKRVENGCTIILLGGTTIGAMCPYLIGKKLNVITNSLSVADQLKEFTDLSLIMLGGIYNHGEYEFLGNVTTLSLRQMHADSLFMSCTGFSPTHGFMTDHIDSIDFYRLCMKSSDKTYMLADSSKASRSGIAISVPAGEVDCIISDSGLPQKDIDALKALGVDVVTV